MKSDPRIPVWPLLTIVTVLFVLSVRAPREWHRVAIPPRDELAATSMPEPGGMDFLASVQVTPLAPWTVAAESGADLPIDLATRELDLSPRSLEISKAAADGLSRDGIDALSLGMPHDFAGFVSSRLTDLDAAAAAAAQRLDLLNGDPHRVEIEPAVTQRYAASEMLDEVAAPTGAGQGPDVDRGGWRLADGDDSPDQPSDTVSTVQRRVSDASRNISSWPYAAALAGRLDALCGLAPPHAPWCHQVGEELQTLSRFDTLSADAVGRSLEYLQELASSGQTHAEQAADQAVRNELARVVHGLRRRLAIWQRIYDLAAGRDFPVSVTISDSLHLQRVIADLEGRLQNVKQRAAWHSYLQTAAAKQLSDSQPPLDTAAVRAVAQQILRRMEYARLTPEQREFLQQPEFLAYSQELKHLAAEPVDYFRLMRELEEYEAQGTAERSGRIAAAQQDLRWSQEEPVVRLGQELDRHYRNANLRLAISANLINRLLPPAKPLQQPIDETILGVRARGQSETVTRLRVAMLPSDGSWQMRLQADGEVASRTYAAHGPARFFTRGLSRFAADKQVTLHPGGIRQQSTEVVANSRTGLAGLQTGVDSIPLLGDLVQVIAARQYESRAPAAESIAENRLAWYIGETIDEQVRQAIEQMQERFATHFHAPMRQLNLNPVALEMRTTEQRMIARYRLAGYHQLAANTPRPLAPGNSLLSLQIHESALNNVIEQFDWEGRRVNLRDVYRELGELFGLTAIQPPEDLPDDVTIRFADRNPLRITFQEGRATLTLGLAELAQGRNRWRNFVVRVHYQPTEDQPTEDQPHADLVRDQYVELMGRLALRDQVALRGIFSRVFSRDKPIDLVSRRLAEDPRLAGLKLAQLEIGDGWLALAISPATTTPAAASRPMTAQGANRSVR